MEGDGELFRMNVKVSWLLAFKTVSRSPHQFEVLTHAVPPLPVLNTRLSVSIGN